MSSRPSPSQSAGGWPAWAHARTTEHLALGAPGHGSTGVHEAGYRRDRPRSAPIPGHISSVAIVDDTLRDHGDELIERVRAVA
jgi:hypothetical protein